MAKSFAKVNPYIKVKGKREDDYHQLDISYLSVNLGDKLTFRQTAKKEIEVSTDANLSSENNLCNKVATSLRDTCGVRAGAKITLEKEIPVGGGLGGGSSDAATTLICLNRLWGCNLSRQNLVELGKEFGADIPFFFYGGYCKGTGTGTNLQQRENIFQGRYIPIICPPFTQRTSEVYAKYDQIIGDADSSKADVCNHTPGNTAGLGLHVENDLEQPAVRLNPELADYLDLLEQANTIATSGLAGSGSCLFGISRTNLSPTEIREDLEGRLNAVSRQATLQMARPTNTGQLVQEVE